MTTHFLQQTRLCKEARSWQKEFKQREEEAHPSALGARKKEAARGVDGVAGAVALPATISSSVCIKRRRREQGGDQGRDQGEVDLHKRAELQFAQASKRVGCNSIICFKLFSTIEL